MINIGSNGISGTNTVNIGGGGIHLARAVNTTPAEPGATAYEEDGISIWTEEDGSTVTEES